VGTKSAYPRRIVVAYELNDSPCIVFMVYSDSTIF